MAQASRRLTTNYPRPSPGIVDHPSDDELLDRIIAVLAETAAEHGHRFPSRRHVEVVARFEYPMAFDDDRWRDWVPPWLASQRHAKRFARASARKQIEQALK
jgi:hypothetical protein